jgi:predicted amidophosphoribosyltransferase
MFKDFKNLLFPKLCACCDQNLLKEEAFICTFCRHELPLYSNFFDGHHDLHKILYGRVQLEQAASLFYFEKKGPIQALIHDLKYRGNKELSFYLGSWLGEILFEAGWQTSIDVVIPVPLHRQRMRERGYNQVKAFGNVYRYPLKKEFQFKNSGIQKPACKNRSYWE